MRKNRLWALFVLLVLVALVAGCDSSGQPSVTLPPPSGASVDKQQPPASAGETMQITVYYSTKDAMHLVPEVRTIPKNDHPAQSAIEQLLADPTNPALVRTLPEGVKLRGVTVKDHVAYVDFNDKLVKGVRLGSAGEILAVGAIVNTLTEFTDVYKVQILVDGKKIDTLYGHLDTSEPLSRAESIIKK